MVRLSNWPSRTPYHSFPKVPIAGTLAARTSRSASVLRRWRTGLRTVLRDDNRRLTVRFRRAAAAQDGLRDLACFLRRHRCSRAHRQEPAYAAEACPVGARPESATLEIEIDDGRLILIPADRPPRNRRGMVARADQSNSEYRTEIRWQTMSFAEITNLPEALPDLPVSCRYRNDPLTRRYK